MNYIYLNRKRTRLNLDKFTENVLDPIIFLLAFSGTFLLGYIGFLVAYGLGVK